jgi:predicted ATP-grasp superfamily ATP-dependent carboligase
MLSIVHQLAGVLPRSRMRLFLSEFICSGALAEESLPPSLAREGRAMRDALAADFAALPGVEVVTTCDPRLPLPPGATGVVVSAAREEQRRFEQFCRECDAVYLIAPELEGVLTARCRIAAALNPRPLNVSAAAAELCGDKFALAERLRPAGVPTIPTRLVDGEDLWSNGEDAGGCVAEGYVVKPRYGAGSQSTWLCRTRAEVEERLARFDPRRPTRQAILQPYLSGRALSVAALFGADGALRQLFPPAEQRLTDDGTFQYRGGRLPVAVTNPQQVKALIRQAAACVPGLRGYVGFDLLERDAGEYLVVEINPRLTTSYIGYRRLTDDHLARGLLHPDDVRSILWRSRVIEFTSAGSVELREEGLRIESGELLKNN